MSDTGVFSYYRHHFRFSPNLPLDKAGKQTYTFQGLPKDAMTVLFEVEPFDFHELERVKSLNTILTVELLDNRGNLVCSGSGSLSESLRGMADKNHDHWVLANGGGSTEFWRYACTSIKFQRDRTFTLILRLDNIDPRTPPGLSITPWIHGGGIELP